MSKHTPEPWSIGTSRITSLNICAIDSDGNEAIVASPNFNFSNHHENAVRIVTCVNSCAGMTDPAAEIAELKRQRDELLVALHDAATSLETIQLRSFGADSYLDDKHSMRAYAGARAAVAREYIASAKGSAS